MNITEKQWARICRALGFSAHVSPRRVAQEIEGMNRAVDRLRENLGRDRDGVRAVLRGALEKL